MKKKYILINTAIVMSCLSFIACGEKTKTPTETNSTNTSSTSINTDDENTAKNDNEELNDVDSTNIDKNKDSKTDTSKSDTNNANSFDSSKENKNLKYPTLNNKEVDNLIDSYITKIFKLYDGLTMDYKITYQDQKFISIHFFGNIKSEQTAYPSKFESTLNINIESAKVMKLNEVVSIDKAFVEKFKENLVKKFDSLGISAADIFDLDNLEEVLNKSDATGNYLSDVQSYFTGNQINIILSVPHAIGDYIEIVLK
ncbi:MAG: hypothetical protein ACRC41_15925 [Sarcina sp.]